MEIYMPFSSAGLARAAFQGIAVSEKIDMQMEFLGVKRIRLAAPEALNKPHQAFKVRLFPMPGSDEYRKLAIRTTDYSHVRRVNAICWHGYKNFFARLFVDWNQYATVRAGYFTDKIEYRGIDDFLNKYKVTKSLYYSGNAACRCYGFDKLAAWEEGDMSHKPPGDFVIKTQYTSHIR